MIRKKPLEGGVESIGPLRGRPSVHVAFRPVDPLVEGRVKDLMERIGPSIRNKGRSISIAVRSVDGFFCTSSVPDGPAGMQLVRVIDYDPVRGIFLLAGDGEPDSLAPLFWFGFRTFEDAGALCAIGHERETLDLPEEKTKCNEILIGCMKDWKRENPARLLGHILYRARDLKEIEDMLDSTLKDNEIPS